MGLQELSQPWGEQIKLLSQLRGGCFPRLVVTEMFGVEEARGTCVSSPSPALPLQPSPVATQSSSDTLATPLIIRVLHGREGCRLDFVSPPDVRLAAAWFQLTVHVF